MPTLSTTPRRSLQSLDEKRVERYGVVVDFRQKSTTPTTPLRNSLSRPRATLAEQLTPSEGRLVHWLENHLHAAGAPMMVKKYGARRVIETLYRQKIVQWKEYTCPIPGNPRHGYSTINPELHRPAGFLFWSLERGL